MLLDIRSLDLQSHLLLLFLTPIAQLFGATGSLHKIMLQNASNGASRTLKQYVETDVCIHVCKQSLRSNIVKYFNFLIRKVNML